ncbi:MAG TPA: hypothetical protein VJT08_08970 [Terriglobales bacterium]|nr:hypothetical protein [Terriglobales bacterium]
MSGTIIHFGADTHNRIPILKTAGYDVPSCDSLQQFESILKTAHPDAVLLTAMDGNARSLVSAIHECSAAPVIAFDTDITEQPVGLGFDLVIEPVTNPAIWLESLRHLIQDTRQSCADSAATRRPEQLRAESLESRHKSARERKRSSGLCE